MKRAVVLLSGGLDSCTAAALAKRDGYAVYALSFDYEQRHQKELECARAIADAVGVAEHKILPLPLGQLGGSALTDASVEVPDAGSNIGAEIPVTYVPGRNTVFLSFALAYAEVVDADCIVIGANALDYSGYPDCRPEYFEAFTALSQLATKQGVEGHAPRIWAPLQHMTKKDIVEAAQAIDAPLHLTWSCYRGDDQACGSCESCVLRLKGFHEAGETDPITYASL